MSMQTHQSELAALARLGVEVRLLDTNLYSVGGFYKSGTVEVNLETLTVTARYNEVTEFDADSDLVGVLTTLNKQWQERSAWRYEGWATAEPAWADLYTQYDLA